MGYAREMWGQYQAIVDGPTGAIVEGVAYEVQSDADAQKLAAYETNAYRTASCTINFGSEYECIAARKVQGLTFMYAGDPEGLKEGRWDRKLWMLNMGMESNMKRR